ncbi:kinase-like protein [Marasmius fiardii PR-910]|nr:kinase-like protein [Marasmius fiardii PR-910]
MSLFSFFNVGRTLASFASSCTRTDDQNTEADLNLGQDYLTKDFECIFEDEKRVADLMEEKGQAAQVWLDRMQQVADSAGTPAQLRTSVLGGMERLTKKSGLSPICLTIRNVRKLGDYPVAYGAFGVVWKGKVGRSSELVCLKVSKLYRYPEAETLFQAYLREAIVWRQMKHPNVLPFLGIYHLENNEQLCLISPWMERGNLAQYVRSTPRERIEYYNLVHDVASGLSYLHLHEIVHGDLKAVNVLITPSGRASIGDVGVTRVAESHSQNLTSSAPRSAGTARWLAPELLNGCETSKQSDIYAYACVCYEIFTGQHPLPEIKLEATVVHNVVQGKHSSRPEDSSELHDFMWKIMESCWDTDPSRRPGADKILRDVQLNTPNSTTAPQAQEWNDDSLSQEIWKNVTHRNNPTIPDSRFSRGTGAASALRSCFVSLKVPSKP